MLSLVCEVKVPDTALMRGEGRQVVNREIVAATEASVAIVVGEIVPRTPVNLGILRGGVQSEVRGESAEGVFGRVFNPVGYAMPVEGGARPHFPPVAALIPWVTRKLGLSGKEARSVAFLVARKISRVGTRARLMFSQGLAAAKPRVDARYELALKRIVEGL